METVACIRNMRNAQSENLKGINYPEDLDVKGGIILKWILDKYGVRVWIWIHLAEDKVQWRPPVNMVMNFRVL
jgi:hypothetical protein